MCFWEILTVLNLDDYLFPMSNESVFKLNAQELEKTEYSLKQENMSSRG